MSGVFVCIVGPSGAGKDTLIVGSRAKLAGDERFVFPRRLVTRTSSIAEEHDTLCADEFRTLDEARKFAVSWKAHGLSYAIPGQVHTDIEGGRVCICNLSRGAIKDACEKFQDVRVVLVSAPREALRQRLLARGRESAAQVDARLDREERQEATRADLTISNVGPVDANIDQLVSFLELLSASADRAPQAHGVGMMSATVVSVSSRPVHGFSKFTQDSITLVQGEGVLGDAHRGVTVKHRSRVKVDPTQPNLRQVHLIGAELLDELRAKGFRVDPGSLGENVLTSGIDLLALPTGAKLHLGASAIVEITGLRNPCVQLDDYQRGLTAAVLDRDEDGNLIRKAGIMGTVLAGGEVRPGDGILIVNPALPHRKLEKV